jgi:hypothetical protein
MFIGIKLLAVAETMVRWVKIMKGENGVQYLYNYFSDDIMLHDYVQLTSAVGITP